MDDLLLQKISPEHLLTLYQITRTMNSSLDFDQVLNQALDSVMQVTHAERGFLMIADAETEALSVRVARGVSGDLAKDDAYSTTIVQQVVETRAPLLTNNAMFDERYEAGKSIIMRGLRAILCAPMLVKERLVGVVYVDTAIRSGNFTEADRELLSAVAGQAGVAIENARLYTVAVEKGRIERELQMARDMQAALMPHTMPYFAGYEFTATCIPAREMAGDFYDVFLLSDGQLGVVVADVSDKGAAAALFMAVSRSFIRSYAHAGFGALGTLKQTNGLILDDAESGMFVTAYHSVFDANGRCYNVNAGHNPPLLYRHAEQTVSYLPRGGMAIGWFEENPMQQIDLTLLSGDVIVYYTDGLTEAENPAGDFYGESRLEAVILRVATEPVQVILDTIIEDVEGFIEGLVLADDLTLFVMRYTG